MARSDEAAAKRAALDRLPFPVLIGDIGGTNARFALITDAEGDLLRFPDTHTADHPTIDDAIEHVIRGLAVRPRAAVLALAGPIAGEQVQLTNCDWIVVPKRLITRFGLKDCILLNDFEALSLSLAALRREDVDPIGDGAAEPDRARLVVGPGTGLGAGALIHAGGLWIPIPGEGGHIDLGPVTDRDMAIWPHLERVMGRVSAEALLSGGGLLRLYDAVAATDGVRPRLVRPAEVSDQGLAAGDRQAAEAVKLFATYLGRFAGDLALVFTARGGVYLAGGVTLKIAAALKSGVFREAFVAKEPHRRLLERMATAIVVKPDAALAGIADFARRPPAFGVELGGRHWRG
jgi:glucokinase